MQGGCHECKHEHEGAVVNVGGAAMLVGGNTKHTSVAWRSLLSHHWLVGLVVIMRKGERGERGKGGANAKGQP
jgi:hypothetical protein